MCFLSNFFYTQSKKTFYVLNFSYFDTFKIQNILIRFKNLFINIVFFQFFNTVN